MQCISELDSILSQQLDWQKSRVDCFSQMLLALFVVRSVNLGEIAVAMEGSKFNSVAHLTPALKNKNIEKATSSTEESGVQSTETPFPVEDEEGEGESEVSSYHI